MSLSSIDKSQLNFNDAVEYHHGKFPPSNLDYRRLLTPLAQAADALARYDQMLKNMHNSDLLLAPLRNQEAVISSRMEGTISTMDEILRFEAEQDADTGEPRRFRDDVIETILYRRALVAAQTSMAEGQPISRHLIRSIHQHLLSFGRGARKSPGEFKTEQNYLADHTKRNIKFVPVAPEHLDVGLERLFSYIEGDEQILIKTGVTHLEFEALHPFMDGNGRIGRMLITLMLWSREVISAPHFYISAYLEEEKDSYIDLMREVSRTGDWTPWCEFFLTALERQAITNLKMVEDIQDLYEQMKEIFRDVLSSRWSVDALDFVFTNPIFFNNRFTTRSGIPSNTAARFSRVLIENDLLAVLEESAGRRPALLSFEPLMSLVRV